MKKLLSLIMALGLTLSLIGCGSKGPEILGTYDTKFDIKDMLVEQVDSQMGLDVSLGDYVESFDVAVVYEFKEDGTYSQNIDMDAFEASFENLKAALVPYMENVFVSAFRDQIVAVDPTAVIESVEDIESFLGMTFDEIMIQSVGMDFESFVNVVMDESMPLDDLQNDAQSEGKYKAEGGKLYMSESLDTDINESAYEVYTIKGNVVTVTEGVNIESNDIVSYPFELIKR